MTPLETDLVVLGFSQYEARAYLSLLRHPGVNGYEVSRQAGIPTAKIYETLAKLVDRGAAIASLSEPVRYLPIAPEVFFGEMRQKVMARIDGLMEALPSWIVPTVSDTIWPITGRTAILRDYEEAIQSAAHEIFCSAWVDVIVSLSSSLLEAQKRGVRLLIAVLGEQSQDLPFSVLPMEFCGMKAEKRLGHHLSVLVTDDQHLLIGSFDGDEGVGSRTDHPHYVLLAKEYIRHDVFGHVMIGQVGQAAFERWMADAGVAHVLEER
ncbi:MAG: TrmB family transcriptional regulator [Bacilli bacterium]